MEICIYCQGPCRFTISNLTCTHCGAEQDQPVYENEWNVHDRVCSMDISTYDTQKSFNPHHSQKMTTMTYSDKQHNIIKDNLMTIQSATQLPDSIIESAEQMYHAYTTHPQKHTVKGEQRRLQFLTACSYFSAKSMRTGSLTLNQIVQMVFKNNIVSIHWACKEIVNILCNDTRFSHLFTYQDVHITDSITRVSKTIAAEINNENQKINSQECSKIHIHTQDIFKKLYKMAHRIMEKIEQKNKTFVTQTRSDHLASSLVFVAYKLLKETKITLKTFAVLSGTNETTLVKLENQIKTYLVGK